MFKELLAPLIQAQKQEPESPEVKAQIDELSNGVWLIFGRTLYQFGFDLDMLRSLMYGLKQKDLDNLYKIVLSAMRKRPKVEIHSTQKDTF